MKHRAVFENHIVEIAFFLICFTLSFKHACFSFYVTPCTFLHHAVVQMRLTVTKPRRAFVPSAPSIWSGRKN